jgi:RNA polymerase sigma-70 factor (ECF subfamily)
MLAVAECEQPPVGQARAGSPEAWDALFQRYQLPLYAYVFELVQHEQSSLDVVQETFINAIRYLHTLRDDHKFGSWLFGIAHQKCVQQWRRQGKAEVLLPEPELATLVGLDEAPDEQLIRKEQEAEFMTSLHQLPPPQRSVLLLHFIEEFSLQEISAITQTPLGTVKSRLHYAKQALRTLLTTPR